MYTVVYEKDSQLCWATISAENFAEAESMIPRMRGKDCTIISISLHSQSAISFGNGMRLHLYSKDAK